MFPRTTQVILAAEIQNRANSAPFPTCHVVVLSLISSYIISGNQPRWLMCWWIGACLFLTINQYFICAPHHIFAAYQKSSLYMNCYILSCFVSLWKGLTSERCNNVTMLHCIFPLLHSWPQTIAPVICQSNCGAGWHSSCHWQIQKQNNDGDLVMSKIQRPDMRSNPTKTACCSPFGPQ